MVSSTITNNGKKIIMNRAYKSSPDYTCPSKFKIGINNSDPDVFDTDLDNPVPPVNTMEVLDTCATENWTESADATAEAANTSSFKEGANQTDDTSLDLGKSGTASAVAYYEKTLGGTYNGTSKDLFVWVKIEDAAALAKISNIEIRIGSDNSNYYYLVSAVANLSVGWNLITMRTISSEGTASGSPDITNLDYLYLGITVISDATTLSSGDVKMDLWQILSSDDYFNTYVSGYPTFDETNNEVTTRTYLDSLQANGFNINGFALFNTDSPDLMHSVDVFVAESKSSTDVFAFVVKDRFL